MNTYTHTDKDGDTLEVEPYRGCDDTAMLTVSDLESCAVVVVPKADAPRVALELLKAAGITSDSKLGAYTKEHDAKNAVYFLEQWAAKDAAEAAAEAARRAETEAADKTRLDQEAEKLRTAYYGERLCHWSDLSNISQTRWRDIALAARELHKDGTK